MKKYIVTFNDNTCDTVFADEVEIDTNNNLFLFLGDEIKAIFNWSEWRSIISAVVCKDCLEDVCSGDMSLPCCGE